MALVATVRIIIQYYSFLKLENDFVGPVASVRIIIQYFNFLRLQKDLGDLLEIAKGPCGTCSNTTDHNTNNSYIHCSVFFRLLQVP